LDNHDIVFKKNNFKIKIKDNDYIIFKMNNKKHEGNDILRNILSLLNKNIILYKNSVLEKLEDLPFH
jgi:hypothetical protein